MTFILWIASKSESERAKWANRGHRVYTPFYISGKLKTMKVKWLGWSDTVCWATLKQEKLAGKDCFYCFYHSWKENAISRYLHCNNDFSLPTVSCFLMCGEQISGPIWNVTYYICSLLETKILWGEIIGFAIFREQQPNFMNSSPLFYLRAWILINWEKG